MVQEAVVEAISATTEKFWRELDVIWMDKIQSEKKELSDLKENVRRQMSETKRLEQYSSKQNIKIFGLNESEIGDLQKKVINLSNELGVEIERNDVAIATVSVETTETVIVKFVKRKTKDINQNEEELES